MNHVAFRAAFSRLLPAFACAAVLAGCIPDAKTGLTAAQPRGATVAFESIEGPPPAQFHTLVQNLNDEAQIRRLAVLSREAPSVYRVRGYLAAKQTKGHSTIAWVWDVFDGDERRALRISGEETSKVRYSDAWTAADDAMLRRIARTSMEQLATFLTSPEVTPVATANGPQLASIGQRDASPEAAGIFRIFQADADPMPAETPAVAAENAGPVPLPRRRPDEAVSAAETLTMAAASH